MDNYPSEAPKEEMNIPSSANNHEPIVRFDFENKTDSSSIKNVLLKLDPSVEDAYQTIGIALKYYPELYEKFINSFILSMIQAETGSNHLDSQITVAKFAAKSFFDKWIENTMPK